MQLWGKRAMGPFAFGATRPSTPIPSIRFDPQPTNAGEYLQGMQMVADAGDQNVREWITYWKSDQGELLSAWFAYRSGVPTFETSVIDQPVSLVRVGNSSYPMRGFDGLGDDITGQTQDLIPYSSEPVTVMNPMQMLRAIMQVRKDRTLTTQQRNDHIALIRQQFQRQSKPMSVGLLNKRPVMLPGGRSELIDTGQNTNAVVVVDDTLPPIDDMSVATTGVAINPLTGRLAAIRAKIAAATAARKNRISIQQQNQGVDDQGNPIPVDSGGAGIEATIPVSGTNPQVIDTSLSPQIIPTSPGTSIMTAGFGNMPWYLWLGIAGAAAMFLFTGKKGHPSRVKRNTKRRRSYR